MHQLYGGSFTAAELTWDVVWPLLMLVVLLALGVPVWVSLGCCAVGLLVATQVLPLSIFGEALFPGIDAFAPIALPLYLLTGDAMVRTHQRCDQVLYMAIATHAKCGYRDTTMREEVRFASVFRERPFVWFCNKAGLFQPVIRRNAETMQTVFE